MGKRKLYCYSKRDFDSIMELNGWKNSLPDKLATISICSFDDRHWFSNDVEHNFNATFNDCDPTRFWIGKDMYDYDSVWNNYEYEIDNDYLLVNKNDDGVVENSMNPETAVALMKFIDKHVAKGYDIFVHCTAGQSRSQGVVRYILDTYRDIDWETRKDNPCETPNWHVVTMLKRAIFLYGE